MEIYFLKTKHNQSKTDLLSDAIASVNLELTVVEDGYLSDIRTLGVQNIPSVVAVHDGVILKQTDNPYSLVTFRADSEALIPE